MPASAWRILVSPHFRCRSATTAPQQTHNGVSFIVVAVILRYGRAA